MILRFNLPLSVDSRPLEERRVEYDCDAAHRAPVLGESVVADGSDPLFPAGVYRVRFVTHHFGLRGPTMAVCDLDWVYGLPKEMEPR